MLSAFLWQANLVWFLLGLQIFVQETYAVVGTTWCYFCHT